MSHKNSQHNCSSTIEKESGLPHPMMHTVCLLLCGLECTYLQSVASTICETSAYPVICILLVPARRLSACKHQTLSVSRECHQGPAGMLCSAVTKVVREAYHDLFPNPSCLVWSGDCAAIENHWCKNLHPLQAVMLINKAATYRYYNIELNPTCRVLAGQVMYRQRWHIAFIMLLAKEQQPFLSISYCLPVLVGQALTSNCSGFQDSSHMCSFRKRCLAACSGSEDSWKHWAANLRGADLSHW